METLNSDSILFFNPDKKFIKWLVKYANGRLIIDIGCGSGALCWQLALNGAKVMGVDPYYKIEDLMVINKKLMNAGIGTFNILPWQIEKCNNLIQKLGNNVLFLFARPCHSDFVENALTMRVPGTEGLYITVPRNLREYDDLGQYKKDAVLVLHEGKSVDNEVVYSIK